MVAPAHPALPNAATPSAATARAKHRQQLLWLVTALLPSGRRVAARESGFPGIAWTAPSPARSMLTFPEATRVRRSSSRGEPPRGRDRKPLARRAGVASRPAPGRGLGCMGWRADRNGGRRVGSGWRAVDDSGITGHPPGEHPGRLPPGQPALVEPTGGPVLFGSSRPVRLHGGRNLLSLRGVPACRVVASEHSGPGGKPSGARAEGFRIVSRRAQFSAGRPTLAPAPDGGMPLET